MKAISASIVALAGAVLLASGLSGNDYEHKMALTAGGMVLIAGLIAWVIKFVGRSD